MKKVTMIEYQGRCDVQGKAVGHAPKVLREYYDFIKDIADVEILAPRDILQELPGEMREKSKCLPGSIVMKGHKSFYDKIDGKVQMFRNLRLAFRQKTDIIWLFNVEYYVMLYLFLHGKPDAKLVCTLFLDKFTGDGLTGRVKAFIFAKARKKMDFIIATGANFSFPECRTVYIPDYYDQPEKYGIYRKMKKKRQAVCLGTMGNGKQLEEMVEAFSKNGYPLVVCGRFYDKERFSKLKAAAGVNITLIDRYLSDSEYLELLAVSTYTVLPYAKDQYNRQTSGVLQEAVFVNTVPVSYREILEGNHIEGVGFSDWQELTEEFLTEAPPETFYCGYEKLRNTQYKKENVAAKYHEIFGTPKR